MSQLLNISEATSIGIHSMAYIASKESRTTTIEISRSLGISENHLSKVLQRLAKNNLVQSTRGPGGGFTLSREKNRITLREIYEAIDGPLDEFTCLFKTKKCTSPRCVMGDTLTDIKVRFQEYLTKTRLSDISSIFSEETIKEVKP